MKLRMLLPPFAILACGVVWLSAQARTIRDLERQSAQLSRSMEGRRAVESSRIQGGGTRKTALDRTPVDWREVSRQLRARKLIGGIFPTDLRLQDAFRAMSVEEILSALDQLESAGLLHHERERIEMRLASELMEKDPELGLTRFLELDGWLASRHFSDWVARDPDAAVEWLRRQDADGRRIPNPVVAQSFFKTLADSPETAGAILGAISAEKRLESLRSLEVGSLHQSGQEEWAELVRAQLPEEDRLEAISWPVGNWSDGDGAPMMLPEVDAYLNRIAPSPEELEAIVLKVSSQRYSWGDRFQPGSPIGESIEVLRAWVEGHAPELMEAATANALKSALSSEGSPVFPQVAASALAYHAGGSGDGLLIPLLESYAAREHRELAASIAARLSDETLRNTYLEKLGEGP